ncbi:MAG: glycoside hydrolase family 65 protein [Thermotogota bacterium]
MEKTTLSHSGFDPQNQPSKETVFTLSNGFIGIRGSIEFFDSTTKGSFCSGCFNSGNLALPELVKIPDPLALNVWLHDKDGLERLMMTSDNVSEFMESIDLKKGTFEYNFNLRSQSGYRFKIEVKRFVSSDYRHLWGRRVKIHSKDYSGVMLIENAIDTVVYNNTGNPLEKCNHFKENEALDLGDSIGLISVLSDSGERIVQFKKMFGEEDVERIRFSSNLQTPVEVFRIDAKSGESYTVNFLGGVYHLKEIDQSWEKVLEEFMQHCNAGINNELLLHEKKFQALYHQHSIEIKGDDQVNLALNWCISQLTNSALLIDEHASIGAKGLHGEGYKGHVFWDTEIFMLPFFIYTYPDIAKKLLMYRYNTLEGAKENASASGYKGAQYAWESAGDGREVTPKWGVDYNGKKVRIWTGDIEYHISADIALSIYQYYRATLDEEFLVHYGCEIIFNTALFWESRLEYNQEQDRYEITDVIGPDEFHEHVDNNVYTNFLAGWNLGYAVEAFGLLTEINPEKAQKLSKVLQITEEKLVKWQKMAEKIYIPKALEGNVIEQFEGYFKLAEYPITAHDDNGMPLWPERVDPGNLNDTTLIKQPDLLMLMYLMPEYFEGEVIKENYDFYEKRTMHKSSLSPCIHSLLSISVHEYEHAYEYFKKTLFTDLQDNQGNTALGLHAAAAGGAWLSAVMGFGRFFIDKDDIVNFDPWIPDNWSSLSYSIVWRGQRIQVRITNDKFFLISDDDFTFKLRGKGYQAKKNIEMVCDLR